MKRLTLRSERLAELGDADLVRVAGGAPSVFCTSALTFCDAVCEATDAVTALTPRCTAPTI